MLKELAIKNFILVDFQEIFFEPGLNIITGETGTGKSLIIDALSLLLGARASEDLIRRNCPSALVEAVFGYTPSSDIERWLASQDLLDLPGGEVVLSREISREGKSRCRINGTTVNLADLRTVGSWLVDIYGQGEHEQYFIPSRQLALLDTFLDQPGNRIQAEYQTLYRQRKLLGNELEALLGKHPENIEDARFSVQEMRDLGLDPDRLREVEDTFRMAGDAQGYQEALHTFLALCEGEDGICGILPALARARAALEGAPGPGPGDVFIELSRSVKTTEETLREALYEARKAQNTFDITPDQFASLERLVAEIERIKRKHRVRTTDELIGLIDRCERMILEHEEMKLQKQSLEQQLQALEEALMEAGSRLSAARRRAAEQMEEALEDELKQLAFSRVEFNIHFSEEEPSLNRIQPEGLDHIGFNISLNPGEEPGPVRQVASGGEISRIILGLKSITLEKSGVGTMVFDEIDQGIGGQTAFWVGEKLKRLSTGYQVLCITHLPQIACFAGNHIKVDKESDQHRTWATVIHLDDRESRIRELSRMMGGQSQEMPALQYAKTLLDRAGKAGPMTGRQ